MQRRFMRLMQASVKPRWAWDVGLLGGPHTLGHVSSVLGKAAGVEQFWAWMGANFDASVTWKDLEAIRSAWSGPLVVKGILTADDARSAVALGANGVVVSNHGGRQLDGARSSISALLRVADAIGGKATILMDGGIRTGLDVVRALASGANGVLLGRAWVYGLAARGERGVTDILRIIASEMRTALALSGHVRVSDVGQHTLDLDD